jgi:putative aldouronate transport system substrate-binding protein
MKKLALLATILLPLLLAACGGSDHEPARPTVTLAAPQSAYITDFSSNSYKLWLEEQTGLNIEIIWLPQEDATTLVRQQLTSGTDMPDAYIGFGTLGVFDNPDLQGYGESGAIIPLGGLINEYGTHTKTLWEELAEYDIERYMTASDGNIYFMPGFSASPITQFQQLMWVNQGWLDDLGLAVPTTTDEFSTMLRAFKSAYPDYIPMAGTEAHYSKQPYDFLINSFVYNNVRNSRLLLENDKIGFAPTKAEWREALVYLRGLYDEGLYSPLSFTQDNQQLNQMANDTLDILGAFLSPGISLTVYQNSPDIMKRYVAIAPLAGPEGVKFSTVFTSLPRPNGVITSACENPEAVFRLFDLMLSEEACLMGRYGEQGVDWEFAGADDISIYGTPATIKIIHQIWNTPQNKHLAQIGPYVSRPKYSGGVTWNGSQTDGEYMNAQGALLNQQFAPTEYITALIYSPEEEARIAKIRTDIENHVKQAIIDFTTGTRNIYDDAEWKTYINEYDALGLPEFLAAAQTAWDRSLYVQSIPR